MQSTRCLFENKVNYNKKNIKIYIIYLLLDAYRALELLEEYYNRLDAPEDKPLKNAIDR